MFLLLFTVCVTLLNNALGETKINFKPSSNLTEVTTTASIDTSTVVGYTSSRYVGYNFDWHPNTDGPPYWINCSVQVIDFSNEYLKTAVSNLPTRLRIGGSEGDDIIYNVKGTECNRYSTPSSYCLEMDRWHQIVNFTTFYNISLIFGLNAQTFRPNNSATYNFTNTKHFLQYTYDNNLNVFGFEFGNEKKNIDPHIDVDDYKTLRGLIDSIWNDSETKPKLMGNDLNPDPSYLNNFLPKVCLVNNSNNAPVLDIVTYHNYNLEGDHTNPNLASEIMTPGYMDNTYNRVSGVIDSYYTYCRGNGITEIYVGETAAAWASGQYNITNTFESCFWYSDALGKLATYNHTGFQRQTLIGGAYGLLSQRIPAAVGDTQYNIDYLPNPDYYLGLLFHKLVNNKMLNVELSNDGNGYLRGYSYCSRLNKGNLGMVLINIAGNNTFTVSVDVGMKQKDRKGDYKGIIINGTIWELTADSLKSRVMKLNGNDLIMETSNELPCLVDCGEKLSDVTAITVNPYTIIFIDMFADADICLQ